MSCGCTQIFLDKAQGAFPPKVKIPFVRESHVDTRVFDIIREFFLYIRAVR